MRSREYDLDFRARSQRIRTWGIGLLALAAVLWGWCAVLLLTSYQADGRPGAPTRDCEARLLTDLGTANEGYYKDDHCDNERDWPEALAVLGLSIPVFAAGTTLLTVAIVSTRMSAHSEAMRELDRLADS
ncbi:hypothetical protein [Streptomyces sp. NPDC003023]|uniref:hypothetical protein n=1 Tax=Streptomyces sp. NPDC003023 TaxID=3364675 RepID=UPI00368CB524